MLQADIFKALIPDMRFYFVSGNLIIIMSAILPVAFSRQIFNPGSLTLEPGGQLRRNNVDENHAILLPRNREVDSRRSVPRTSSEGSEPNLLVDIDLEGLPASASDIQRPILMQYLPTHSQPKLLRPPPIQIVPSDAGHRQKQAQGFVPKSLISRPIQVVQAEQQQGQAHSPIRVTYNRSVGTGVKRGKRANKHLGTRRVRSQSQDESQDNRGRRKSRHSKARQTAEGGKDDARPRSSRGRHDSVKTVSPRKCSATSSPCGRINLGGGNIDSEGRGSDDSGRSRSGSC